MSEQPPSLPNSHKTFYHHAATACLVSPFAAFALNLALGPLVRLLPPSPMTSLLTALPGVLALIAGVILGVASLFGISKYGKKGILWKTLIGLGIWLLLILLAIPAIMLVQRKAQELRYQNETQSY